MNYYAKQCQVGVKVKIHFFTVMQDRDDWVKVHYDDLGARQCSELEAVRLATTEELIAH